MGHIILPKPNYLDSNCIYLKVVAGRKVWRSKDGKRYYTWDELHGEIEIFNKRGRHLGSADYLSGKIIKDQVKGRRLDV